MENQRVLCVKIAFALAKLLASLLFILPTLQVLWIGPTQSIWQTGKLPKLAAVGMTEL